jgi:hypothetical protein
MGSRPKRDRRPPAHLAAESAPGEEIDALINERVPEVWWEIVRIKGERRKHDAQPGEVEYEVVWASKDGKRWDPSWQPASNVTKRAIEDWERYKSSQDLRVVPAAAGRHVLFVFAHTIHSRT